MSEWWTYRPEDFLLFSPRVYWRLFELHNAALWPLHDATLASGLVMMLMIARGSAAWTRWIPLGLAVLWIFVGWSFLRDRYATINWAASYIAPVFIVEGALLLVASVTNALGFEQRRPADSIGYLVLGLALLGLPLLAPLQGRGWVSSEVFGVAPDPTVVATVGVLLLARGRLVPWLLPIPMLWCLLSGMTLQAMGEPQAFAPYTAVALAAIAWIWRMLSYARK